MTEQERDKREEEYKHIRDVLVAMSQHELLVTMVLYLREIRDRLDYRNPPT